MPTVNQPPNVNFCVPTALAALTDGDFGNALALLSKELGAQLPNKPLFYPLILKVLKSKGYLVDRVQHFGQLGIYLLCFNGHVAVVENNLYVDNSHPFGKKIDAHTRLARLEAIYRITPPEERKTK